jgi:hypothetical protein
VRNYSQKKLRKSAAFTTRKLQGPLGNANLIAELSVTKRLKDAGVLWSEQGRREGTLGRIHHRQAHLENLLLHFLGLSLSCMT